MAVGALLSKRTQKTKNPYYNPLTAPNSSSKCYNGQNYSVVIRCIDAKLAYCFQRIWGICLTANAPCCFPALLFFKILLSRQRRFTPRSAVYDGLRKALPNSLCLIEAGKTFCLCLHIKKIKDFLILYICLLI